mgnify:CR=1 FL=1
MGDGRRKVLQADADRRTRKQSEELLNAKEYCADLDVSLMERAISVVDERRKVVKEGKVRNEPETIAASLDTKLCR